MNKFNYTNLTPFKWFVLENFPFIEADFDALTEWQLFCKIGKEMNKIIDSQNSVGQEMETISQAFISLQNYVNDYFENLDVQDEIDNKLNEMAESGELTEIIEQYLQLAGLLCFNTKQDLKNAENLVNGSFAKTFGNLTYNDGYGNYYKIREIRNTDVIDDINIIALTNFNTLIAELIPNFYESEVEQLSSVIKNVKQFGAKGDGTTDDTQALVNAINSLNDGESLYFPAGDYIVYSDYSANTNNPSYPINKILKLVNKKHITLYGENKATRIRPPYQGRNSTKVYYPCTLTINKCRDITIKDLIIESKGENYGNADAGTSATVGDARADFVMANGGSAILISASKRVNISNCEFRLCGSCGVVYHSDISDCIVENCFSNCASLGYAGFAIDTFCYNSTNYNGKITYRNCLVKAETLYQPENGETQIGIAPYSSKGGIVTEGSEAYKLDVSCFDCEIYDCYGNSGNNFWEGVAIYGEYTNFDIERCKTGNVFASVRIGIFQWASKSIIKDNEFYNKYAGIVLRNTGANLPNSYIDIINNVIKVDTTTTPPESAVAYLNYHACIVDYQGYNTNIIKILNNLLEGDYAFYQDKKITSCKFAHNTFNGAYGIYSKGGGNLTITDNQFNITNLALYMANIDEDNIVAGLTMKFCKNYIESTTNKNVVDIGNSNQDHLFITLDDNKLVGCSIMIPSLTATNIGMKQSLIMKARCIARGELQGSNSVIIFDLKGTTYIRGNSHLFKDDDYKNNTPAGISMYDMKTSTLTVLLSGDVRSKYQVDKFYQIIEKD